MGPKGGRHYSPKFKFTVVLEVLKGETPEAEIARAFEVHPAAVSRWRKRFLDKGREVFGGSEEVKEYEERIGQLEEACRRALHIGGVTYRSIKSILEHGLDRLPLEEQTALEVPQDHDNVRGPDYHTDWN